MHRLGIFLAVGMLFLSGEAPRAYAQVPEDHTISFGQKSPSFSGSYLAGREALKNHDYGTAAIFFKKALAQKQGDPDLLNRVFILTVSAGNMQEAYPLVEKILQVSPENRVAQLVHAVSVIKEGHFEEAYKILGQKMGLVTSLDVLTLKLLSAWCLTQKGTVKEANLGEAIAELDVLGKDPALLGFKLFHSALISDFLGAKTRADRDFAASYEQSKMSLRVTQAYGNLLQREKKFKEARQVYQEFLKISPRNPWILSAIRDTALKKVPSSPFIQSPQEGIAEVFFGLASVFLAEKNEDVALVYTQLALYLRPNFDIAQALSAEIWENMERPDQAIAIYNTIKPSSPLYENAQVQIAKNLSLSNKNKEAITVLHKVLEKNPKSFQALLMLGNLFRTEENWQEASLVYTKLIDIVSHQKIKPFWSLFYFRGVAFERLKKWEKAERDLKKALSLDSQQPQVLNYLGYSYIDRGENLDEALSMVKKAVELMPNDGYILDSLGWAYYKLKKYEQAVAYLERAIELKPDDPLINDHYGDALWRVDRILEAKYQWAKAKEYKPNPDDLKKIEKKLRDGLQ